MPFCPKCRYEYREGVALCPDCNEKLVPHLAESSGTENVNDNETPKDWIPLVRLTSLASAEMIIDILRSKGIPAVLLSGTGHFGFTGQMGISSFRPMGGAYTIMISKTSANDAAGEAAAILGDEWEKVRLV
ncbi:hypothetical protein TRIP_C21001 [Candidatus Zixiibacteriota bacterium]|nr:hypothetical protein TRIP_C21001 [candidate division Zixibacteria bacterium]